MQTILDLLVDDNAATAHELLSTYYGYCMAVVLARFALVPLARRAPRDDTTTRLLLLVAAAAFLIDMLPGDTVADMGGFALLGLALVLGAGIAICSTGMRRPHAGHCYLSASAWLAVLVTTNLSREALIGAAVLLAVGAVLAERMVSSKAG